MWRKLYDKRTAWHVLAREEIGFLIKEKETTVQNTDQNIADE